jgi:hypothetical protein
MPVETTIKHRRDTESNWSGKTLADGEIGYVSSGTNKGKFKIGDGTTVWGSLPYAPAGNADTATTASKITSSGLNRAVFVSSTAPTGAVAGDIWIQTA